MASTVSYASESHHSRYLSILCSPWVTALQLSKSGSDSALSSTKWSAQACCLLPYLGVAKASFLQETCAQEKNISCDLSTCGW